MNKHKGGCICGEVKFIVNLDEKPRVFNCHCIDCRKKVGGMITIIDLREGAIDIDKNKLGIYEHIGGSGNKIQKHYCKKCTAPILTYVAKWKKFYLYAGMLDDISILKTANNIWYTNSHFPFLEINEKKIKI
jgi:hypothetical protein|tara:strand:- start:56 stop:451 length:396 start_codon:yes stop_codon:yes gene_type:complete